MFFPLILLYDICQPHVLPLTRFYFYLYQVVQALDVLYDLLRTSPPREQVQAALLDWGVEQLYSLLLNRNFGDEARERVFRVRKASLELI